MTTRRDFIFSIVATIVGPVAAKENLLLSQQKQVYAIDDSVYVANGKVPGLTPADPERFVRSLVADFDGDTEKLTESMLLTDKKPYRKLLPEQTDTGRFVQQYAVPIKLPNISYIGTCPGALRRSDRTLSNARMEIIPGELTDEDRARGWSWPTKIVIR